MTVRGRIHIVEEGRQVEEGTSLRGGGDLTWQGGENRNSRAAAGKARGRLTPAWSLVLTEQLPPKAS